jgi:uncharacterized protein YbjT (DUF2867 family)
MILVVGATGVLGLEVCRRLRTRNQPVRAMVRTGSAREEELGRLGAEVVHGDLRSREAVEAACRGATAVVSTATAMASKERANDLRAVDRDGQLSLVDAAKKSGVRHFVYVSISPNYRELAPLMRYKREVERAVRQSGMRWTILQPSNFMEIWLSSFLGWDFRNGRAMIFGSGVAPVSWISVHDVAEYCAMALEDSRMVNRDVPLGGPEALPPNEVVRILERLGSEVSSEADPARDPRRALASRRVVRRAPGLGNVARLAIGGRRRDRFPAPTRAPAGADERARLRSARGAGLIRVAGDAG